MDPLHYYTTLQMFGVGRCSYDASQEIRHRHITREEGVALVRRFDQEFPARYWNEICDYLGLSSERVLARLAAARPEHLWDGEQLKHAVWMEGANA
jgi:hypothetical protein